MEEIIQEEQKDSKLKKIIIGVIALTLLLLFLSYILVSYPLFSIIESLSESKLAKNETIQVNNLSIVFLGSTYKEVQSYYNKNLKVEMALCFYRQNMFLVLLLFLELEQ